MTVTQGGRRDAVRNYHRILGAARDVLGESGAEASMEEIEEFLRAIGQSFADHARYANLLLERPVDPRATQRLRDAVGELTARAAEAGTVAPGVTQADIMALVRAMRGLVHDAGEVQSWPRFLDIHLAGLRAASVP